MTNFLHRAPTITSGRSQYRPTKAELQLHAEVAHLRAKAPPERLRRRHPSNRPSASRYLRPDHPGPNRADGRSAVRPKPAYAR